MLIPCSALHRGNIVRGEKKQRANKLESTILVIHFGRCFSEIASGTIPSARRDLVRPVPSFSSLLPTSTLHRLPLVDQ